eukprot:m.253200 g.253200  ORF g.253200 m.253200 type:complete len:2413 (-) comp17532_c1_seq2:1245-8483(-)
MAATSKTSFLTKKRRQALDRSLESPSATAANHLPWQQLCNRIYKHSQESQKAEENFWLLNDVGHRLIHLMAHNTNDLKDDEKTRWVFVQQLLIHHAQANPSSSMSYFRARGQYLNEINLKRRNEAHKRLVAFETKTFALECFEQQQAMVLGDDDDDDAEEGQVVEVLSLKPLDSAGLVWWLYLVLLDPLLLLADNNAKRLQTLIQSLRSPTREAAMKEVVKALKPYTERVQVPCGCWLLFFLGNRSANLGKSLVVTPIWKQTTTVNVHYFAVLITALNNLVDSKSYGALRVDTVPLSYVLAYLFQANVDVFDHAQRLSLLAVAERYLQTLVDPSEPENLTVQTCRNMLVVCEHAFQMAFTRLSDLNPVFVIINAVIKHALLSDWDMVKDGVQVIGALEYLFKAAIMKKEKLLHNHNTAWALFKTVYIEYLVNCCLKKEAAPSWETKRFQRLLQVLMTTQDCGILLCCRPGIETEPQWWLPLLERLKVGDKQAAKTIRRSARYLAQAALDACDTTNLSQLTKVAGHLRNSFLCSSFWVALAELLKGLKMQDERRFQLAPTLLALTAFLNSSGLVGCGLYATLLGPFYSCVQLTLQSVADNPYATTAAIAKLELDHICTVLLLPAGAIPSNIAVYAQRAARVLIRSPLDITAWATKASFVSMPPNATPRRLAALADRIAKDKSDNREATESDILPIAIVKHLPREELYIAALLDHLVQLYLENKELPEATSNTLKLLRCAPMVLRRVHASGWHELLTRRVSFNIQQLPDLIANDPKLVKLAEALSQGRPPPPLAAAKKVVARKSRTEEQTSKQSSLPGTTHSPAKSRTLSAAAEKSKPTSKEETSSSDDTEDEDSAASIEGPVDDATTQEGMDQGKEEIQHDAADDDNDDDDDDEVNNENMGEGRGELVETADKSTKMAMDEDEDAESVQPQDMDQEQDISSVTDPTAVTDATHGTDTAAKGRDVNVEEEGQRNEPSANIKQVASEQMKSKRVGQTPATQQSKAVLPVADSKTPSSNPLTASSHAVSPTVATTWVPPDPNMTSDQRQRCFKLRLELKARIGLYQQEFASKHGRDATTADIETASETIQKLYATYHALSSKLDQLDQWTLESGVLLLNDAPTTQAELDKCHSAAKQYAYHLKNQAKFSDPAVQAKVQASLLGRYLAAFALPLQQSVLRGKLIEAQVRALNAGHVRLAHYQPAHAVINRALSACFANDTSSDDFRQAGFVALAAVIGPMIEPADSDTFDLFVALDNLKETLHKSAERPEAQAVAEAEVTAQPDSVLEDNGSAVVTLSDNVLEEDKGNNTDDNNTDEERGEAENDDIVFTDEDMDTAESPARVVHTVQDSDDESVAGSQPFQAIMADQQETLAQAKQATAAATKAQATNTSTTAKSGKRAATPTSTNDAQGSPAARPDVPLPLKKLQGLPFNMPTRLFFLREVLSRDPEDVLKGFEFPILSDAYPNLSHYQSVMGPRIIAEALASLEDDARLVARNRMTVKSYAPGKPLATIVYRVTSQLGMALTEGDIIKLEAQDRSANSTVLSLAMVQGIDMTEKDGQASVSVMVHGPTIGQAHRQVQGSVFYRNLNNLVTSIRQYEALMSLDPTTKALPYVLRFKPSVPNGVFNQRVISSRFRNSVVQGLTRVREGLNAEQSDAIKTCLLSPLPIAAIHGPPGCGKTHTVKHLCDVALQAIRSAAPRRSATVAIGAPTKSRAKGGGFKVQTKISAPSSKSITPRDMILVCAPSNAAVDELMQRLLTIEVHTSSCTLGKARVLRLGSEDKLTNTNVKDNSLSRHLRVHMDGVQEAARNLSAQRSELEAKKSQAKGQMATLECQMQSVESLDRSAAQSLSAEISELKRACASYDITLNAVRTKQQQERRGRTDGHRDYEKKLLLEADIVCTTLSGSALEVLRNLQRKVALLIIDEAGQCVEPDVLVPLQHNPDHVIMIGDHLQLSATVLAERNRQDGYNISLFEGLKNMLQNEGSMVQLKEQYRMAPGICHLASQSFYNNTLRTAKIVQRREMATWRKTNRLTSSLYFSNVLGKEEGRRSFANRAECKAVTDVIAFLGDVSQEPLSGCIAVITPYADQVVIIKAELRRQFGNTVLDHVSVNTVDAYQGQERDIVIFSCVRTNAMGFLNDPRRLNVALTRAKLMLIMVGHMDWLGRHTNCWKLIVKTLKVQGKPLNTKLSRKATPASLFWKAGEPRPPAPKARTTSSSSSTSDAPLRNSRERDRDNEPRRDRRDELRGRRRERDADRRPGSNDRYGSRSPPRGRRAGYNGPARRRTPPPRGAPFRRSPPPRQETAKRPAQPDTSAQPSAKQAKQAPPYHPPRDPRLAARAKAQAPPQVQEKLPQFQFRDTDASTSAFKQSFVPPPRSSQAPASGLKGRPSAGPVFQDKVDHRQMKADPIGALFGNRK